MFSTQATHWPPLHTWPAPQLGVPSFTFAVLLQIETPVVQSVTPVWHTLPLGVQGMLAAQPKQLPLLHT